MTTACYILFPHQLFDEVYVKKILESEENKSKYIIMWEHDYFFKRYAYHKLKLVFHRATMQDYYDNYKKKYNLLYVSNSDKNHIKIINNFIKKNKINQVRFYDPIELELKEDINDCTIIKNKDAEHLIFDSPYFLNSSDQNKQIIKGMNTVRHDVFYKTQRIKNKIMVNSNNEPEGKKWSFDTENRLIYPKDQKDVEVISYKSATRKKYIEDAITYVNKHFNKNYGKCEYDNFIYPLNRTESLRWLEDFVDRKLGNFGKYEDALSSVVRFGYHSMLSCLTNVGLITPHDIIEYVKDYKKNIASKEGFIRQVIGWREYCYLIYDNYSKNLESNLFYNMNKRNIPEKFWEGKTGIKIIDDIIAKVDDYAYSHHIERLMCVGNYLLLIGVKPSKIFEWFQTMYIDAYEFVMYPNVYGMLLYGFIDKEKHMMTRPYFCSSNYLKKMSNYKTHDIEINGENYKWEDIFDGLYYNLIDTYSEKFKKIYSTGSAVARWNKFDKNTKINHINNADIYVKLLYSKN